MIRPIDIRLNAAHPELPLAEAVTFTDAPSTVLIRGVPPNCGRWAITAVFVAATYPDGSTTTRAAVQSANGVWVATLPATARSGRTENGLRVMADGIDENGEAVTGYILGVADFAVASLGVTPAPEPGETSWQMLYFDAVPGTLRKGDVAKVDGVLKLYNGTAWELFTTLDNAVTKDSANGVKSSGIWSAIWGTASTAFSSLYDWCVAQLAGKASTADATLTERGPNKDGFSAWDILHTPLTAEQKAAFYAESPFAASGDYRVKIEEFAEVLYLYVGGYIAATVVISEDGLKATFDSSQSQEATTIWGPNGTTVATRTVLQGYQLGSQTDKPLASEAEAEALRDGKLDKSGGTFGATTISLTDEGIVVSDTQSSNSTLLSSSYNFLTHRDGLGVRYFAAPSTSGTLALTADIPYDRITITTGQLQDHAVQKVMLNAATTTLTLPALTDLTGKVSDFGIDVVNGYKVSGTPTAASFSLAGTIGTDYNLIVPKGEDWGEMSALAAGEMAVYYFSLSAFQINDKPTWEVMKKVVELVPVPVAP